MFSLDSPLSRFDSIIYSNTSYLAMCVTTVVTIYLFQNRRRAANKEHGQESVRKNSKESRAVPAPDANAESQASIEVL